MMLVKVHWSFATLEITLLHSDCWSNICQVCSQLYLPITQELPYAIKLLSEKTFMILCDLYAELLSILLLGMHQFCWQIIGKCWHNKSKLEQNALN